MITRSLVLFTVVLAATPLVSARYADFANCTSYVRNLSTSAACTLKDFHCKSPKDPRPLLTLQGCTNVCGSWFDPDPADEVFSRFLMWLLPVIILAAHFHFAPLGWKNIAETLCTIAGNPIGSLWSLLTRLEVSRRAYRRTLAADFEREVAKDLATVATACDEFGWHDPLRQVFRALKNRVPGAASADLETTVNGETAEESQTQLLLKRLSVVERPVACGLLLDPIEEYYIACARQELVSHRHDSQLGTWFAIAGLVGAVLAAFFEVWMSRKRNFSTRTVPMVIMTFHLLVIVQLSGSLGSFTSVLGPLDALNRLQRRLDKMYDARNWPQDQRLDFVSKIELFDTGFKSPWLRTAPYMGMNPVFRPNKHLRRCEVPSPRDRSHYRLLAYSLGFISLSVVTAICHSYFQVGNFGFGCRCIMWTCIGIVWLISLSLDPVFQYFLLNSNLPRAQSYRKLLHYTIIKDSIVTVMVALAITAAHVGMLSTCYCYTGSLWGDPYIDLWPLPPTSETLKWVQLIVTPVVALVLICVLVTVCHYDFHADTWVRQMLAPRTLLCPSQETRHAILVRVEDMRVGLSKTLEGDGDGRNSDERDQRRTGDLGVEEFGRVDNIWDFT